MSKIRKAAKGQECTVRLPGICNWNTETTVLAHIGGAGMGTKRPDIHGAFACSSCHDEIDRRTRNMNINDAHRMHLDAVIRTQEILIEMGLIKCG